jgi:hypothetical protein
MVAGIRTAASRHFLSPARNSGKGAVNGTTTEIHLPFTKHCVKLCILNLISLAGGK